MCLTFRALKRVQGVARTLRTNFVPPGESYSSPRTGMKADLGGFDGR
jgi:hypothetical protein